MREKFCGLIGAAADAALAQPGSFQVEDHRGRVWVVVPGERWVVRFPTLGATEPSALAPVECERGDLPARLGEVNLDAPPGAEDWGVEC